MPRSAPRPCSTCGRVGCQEHTRKQWRKGSDAPRRLNGYRWGKLRAYVLQRDAYLCQCPECEGGKKRLRPADQVHHVKQHIEGGTDSPDNLIAVNAECHERITMAAKGHKRRPRIGLSGWPEE